MTLTVLGLVAGLVSGSRWSLVLAPAAFLVAFEVARIGSRGPTVDAIHLDSMYGIIALVVGRGVTWLLTIPPLLLGVAVGIALAARLGRRTARRPGWIAWSLTAVPGLVTAALAVMLALPATTAPILGARASLAREASPS